MLNIIAAPGEVFDQVRSAAPCTPNWLVPALLFIAVSWLGTWLVFSQEALRRQVNDYSEKAIEKQIAQAHMPQAQADQARQTAAKIAAIGAVAGPVAGVLVIALVSPFLWGFIFWLVGTKFLKGNFPYLKAVEVVGLANTLTALEALVRTLLILALGNVFASPSLALLVKDFDPQNPTHSLLALANVMSFWILAVRAIGLGRLAGVSFGKAALWVFGIWAAYNGLFVGFGFAMQAIFHR